MRPLPEVELVVKQAPVSVDVGRINPSDLEALGAKAGDELELLTRTRAFRVKADPSPDVAKGEIQVNERVLTVLDIEEGAKVVVSVVAAEAVEEVYEPPP